MQSKKTGVRAATALLFLCALGASLQAQIYAKKYAVVIGIDQYDAGCWPNLSYAYKDAKAVATLMRQLQFTVYELYNEKATKAAILSTLLDKLAPKLTANDAVFVFFAGHGHTSLLNGQNWGFIVPSDGWQRQQFTYFHGRVENPLTTNEGGSPSSFYNGLLLWRAAGQSRFNRTAKYTQLHWRGGQTTCSTDTYCRGQK